MGKLVLFLKDATAVEIPLDKERVTIGRRPDNDVCLPHPAVSGEHAAVVTILSDSFLEDLGSTNGTQVNGRSITKHFLRDRDQIDIGRQLLVYLADTAARAEPPPGFLREERHALNQRVEAAHREPRADASAEGRVEPRIATPIGAAVDGAAADIDEELRRAEPRLPPRVAAQPAVRADRSGAAPAAIQANASASEAARRAAPRDIRRDGSADGFDAELLAVRRTHVDTATQEVPVERAPIRHDPGPARVQVRVMTGPQAGRVVPMVSDEFVMGRVGVQVAAIVARGADLVLVPREGPPPIDGDGAPVPAAGRAIAPGDAFEIAGTRLQLLPVE